MFEPEDHTLLVSCLYILTCLKFCTVRGGPAHDNTCTCIFKPFIAGLDVYIILLYNSDFKIHSIFNIEEHVLQIAYRNVINFIVFSSPVQSTGRAIVLTLASALALLLALPFPSRHF